MDKRPGELIGQLRSIFPPQPPIDMEYMHWKNKKKFEKSLSPDKILEKIWAATIRTAKNLLQVYYAIRNCTHPQSLGGVGMYHTM